jgi:hypothetical protein
MYLVYPYAFSGMSYLKTELGYVDRSPSSQSSLTNRTVEAKRVDVAGSPDSDTDSHEMDDLLVIELRAVPVAPYIGAPMIWLQKDSGPQYLEVDLQDTFKNNRVDAASGCDGQLQDKDEQSGYSINEADPIPAGVQQIIRTFRFKTPKANYTSSSKFRLVCRSPGMITTWYSIKLPDAESAEDSPTRPKH